MWTASAVIAAMSPPAETPTASARIGTSRRAAALAAIVSALGPGGRLVRRAGHAADDHDADAVRAGGQPARALGRDADEMPGVDRMARAVLEHDGAVAVEHGVELLLAGGALVVRVGDVVRRQVEDLDAERADAEPAAGELDHAVEQRRQLVDRHCRGARGGGGGVCAHDAAAFAASVSGAQTARKPWAAAVDAGPGPEFRSPPCCAYGCSERSASRPAGPRSPRPRASPCARCWPGWRCTRAATRGPTSPQPCGPTCSTAAPEPACGPRCRRCAARSARRPRRWAPI